MLLSLLFQILLPILLTLLCYGLYHAVQFIYAELNSPLHFIDGPKNASLLAGNFGEILANPRKTSEWRREFGRIFRFKGLFSVTELHVCDVKAIDHLVSHPAVYQRPPVILASTAKVVGHGILSVTSDEHKRQRRILNPAFGVSQVRMLTETFVEKSVQLRDIWNHQITPGESAIIDVSLWLRKMTLDVIGSAGFNYEFNALNEEGRTSELNQVFTQLFHSPNSERYNAFRLAQARIPILRFFPVPGGRMLRNARMKMQSIGRRIVAESLEALRAAEGSKSLGAKRDLLSVLLRANVSPVVPESQRMTEEEAIAQIPSFFLAGQETTSSAVSWALHRLCLNPDVQAKLRDELLTMSTDNPTMEELNSLPYLESVVRETMRVHSPVPALQRMAMDDDVLPLAKPYIDKDGKEHYSLPIPQGQIIHIPILAINTDKEIWGDDAEEFRPDRWEKIPEAANSVPGVWAHLLTFFAGPHNCIGFRFSLVEIKALLFALIRAFEFEPALPEGDVIPSAVGISRPTIAGKGSASTLPLIVKRFEGVEC
ncbi:cytochrome P450 [Roridomyces roridus]|uniref:Cytochrome P450 n=1 Tax=Roridomyces roridus TaxID=1738132 RepID=A0AAD7FG40_9AGAR|nr:cytochrome P450 [Roridomyces roridus]